MHFTFVPMKWFNFRIEKSDFRMRILLNDDHIVLLDGLKSLLSKEEDIEIIDTANTAEKTLEKLSLYRPDLLITDYNLPDSDGLSLVTKAKKLYPSLKIIVLSMHEEGHLVKEIIKAGIDAYVLKKDSHTDLLNAIDAVKNGKTYFSSDINKILIQGIHGREEQKLLTDRERQILRLISKEYTNKMIAEELFISERTVETHRKNIFRKTGTNNLVGLIKYAYSNNLI